MRSPASTPPTCRCTNGCWWCATARAARTGSYRCIPALVRVLDGIGQRGPVIVGRHGGPVRPDTVGDIIRRHLHHLDVHATPHQLRHTFGTEMARAAAGNLVVVARTMGHASMSTTMGYVGWSPEAAPIIDGMYGDAA